LAFGGTGHAAFGSEFERYFMAALENVRGE
jgi:hypothetical protein